MARLEEMTVNAVVRGLVPNSTITIKHVQRFGDQVANVTYVDAEGRAGTQLVYGDQEATIEVVRLSFTPLSAMTEVTISATPTISADAGLSMFKGVALSGLRVIGQLGSRTPRNTPPAKKRLLVSKTSKRVSAANG